MHDSMKHACKAGNQTRYTRQRRLDYKSTVSNHKARLCRASDQALGEIMATLAGKSEKDRVSVSMVFRRCLIVYAAMLTQDYQGFVQREFEAIRANTRISSPEQPAKASEAGGRPDAASKPQL